MPTNRPERGTAPGWRSIIRLFAPVLVLSALLLAHWTGASAQTTAAQPPDQFWMLVESLLARGQLEAAERLASDPAVRSADAKLARARIAIVRGQYDDAIELLRPLVMDRATGDAALELGLLQSLLGRRSEAINTLEPIVDGRAAAETTIELVRAARAARSLGRFRAANGLLRDAAASGGDVALVNTAWGELLLEKYNLPEAVKSFETALQADAEHAPALLGLARALSDENPPAAADRARQALAINPTLADAHVVLAGLALDDRRRDVARDEIAEALAVNPNHLEARSLRAALAYLEGRNEDFRREISEILAVNPSYGEAYRIAAQQVAAAYRFEEAAALVRQALAIDSQNVRARAELGMHLLRTGDEPQAQAALEEAFGQDPFDVVTFNLLGLLDTLQKFDTISDDEIIVRLHPDETPIMGGLVLPLAHQALLALATRYQYVPRGPILIEMFPRHDDFAVRNVGLPGMIGALGACFGRVVTLDSPRARPPGSFNWAATLWHELAHVIALQMSNQRVPRWFTEGLSVYEERRARAYWGREGEFAFLQALARGQAVPLESLNRGFSDPRVISLAYHEASLVVEHIAERFGEPSIFAMLRAYGEGLDDAQMLERVLHTNLADLQGSFDAFLEQRFGSARQALELSDDVAAQVAEGDLGQLETLAAQYPTKYAVLVALARARVAAGQVREAIDAFERAANLVPSVTGENSPGAWIARLRERQGDVSGAMAAFERVLAADNTGIDEARALARLADTAQDRGRLRAAYERIVEVLPMDAEPHVGLGRLALDERRSALATEHFRRAIAAGPADPVAVRTALAESLLMDGMKAEAKREVISALEQAPRFERAQELLLRIVDGGMQEP